MFEKFLTKVFFVLLGLNRKLADRISWYGERQYCWYAFGNVCGDIQVRIREEDEQKAWADYHARLDAETAEREDEIEAAWTEYRQWELDQLEESWRSLEEELCPCGHPYKEHDHEGGYCHSCYNLTHCLGRNDYCPQFGEDPQNYEEYTITNLGGDKGGFTIVE